MTIGPITTLRIITINTNPSHRSIHIITKGITATTGRIIRITATISISIQDHMMPITKTIMTIITEINSRDRSIPRAIIMTKVIKEDTIEKNRVIWNILNGLNEIDDEQSLYNLVI